MRVPSPARLLRLRRILIRGGLFVACLGVMPSAVSFAETNLQGARVEEAAAAIPAPTPAPAPPTPAPAAPTVAPTLVPTPVPAPSLSSQVRDDEELHIATIGPPMRPLVNEFNAIWPTRGQITTYYGEVGPLSPRGHSGLDIAAPEGEPILAADDGEVLKAYWNEDGYGGLIIIGHPSGYETWYGHLDRFDVEKGQQVKRGQEIALMGSTGFSTGPHLHFEVRQDGQLRDPLDFLKEASLKDADW